MVVSPLVGGCGHHRDAGPGGRPRISDSTPIRAQLLSFTWRSLMSAFLSKAQRGGGLRVWTAVMPARVGPGRSGQGPWAGRQVDGHDQGAGVGARPAVGVGGV